jgi:hypothetical protein
MVKTSKKTKDQKYLDVMEVIKADNSRDTKYPLNMARYNFKINNENCNKFTSYGKIAKKIVKKFSDEKIDLSQFVFKADVFRVLRHQIGIKN